MGGGARRAPRIADPRGALLARLILDTTILVSAERGRSGIGSVVEDDDGVVIAAVTAAELLVGIELASPEARERRTRFVERLLAEVPIEPYDLRVARAHARLLAHTRRQGWTRGAHDLLIAATALATDRIVGTADRAGFEGLPGVRFRLP